MRPLHIVQVGCDDTVFDDSAPSDTLHRQVEYANELDRQAKGSCITNLIWTNRTNVQTFRRGRATFQPIQATWSGRLFGLSRTLETLHHEKPIDLVTTQTVHAEARTALHFAKRHGIPVIGQIHYDLFSPQGQQDNLGPGLRGWLRRRSAFRTLRKLDGLRVVGRGIERQLRAGEHHHNIHVIPVPVSIPILPEPPLLVDPPTVLFVGRLVQQKNLETWLEVAQEVSRRHATARFVLAGDGPLRSLLEQKTRMLGLDQRLQFLGPVPNADLARLYRESRAFLLTSHYEGFGRVIVEARAQGLPSVAPKITGVEDIIVSGDNGFLVAPGDVAGFASHTLQLINDNGLRLRMGMQGLEAARSRFEASGLTHAWITLLLTTAAKCRSAA